MASYLTFAIESANVFPIVYMFVSSRLKTHAARSTRAKATVGILVLGTVCSILIALFWRSTLFGGSAVLLFLVRVHAMCACVFCVVVVVGRCAFIFLFFRVAHGTDHHHFLTTARFSSVVASIASHPFCTGPLRPRFVRLMWPRCLLGTCPRARVFVAHCHILL